MPGPGFLQPALDRTGHRAPSVGLVVVGHAGEATVETPDAEQTSPGGSGYAVAASAAALIGGMVGLVAQVGPDLDLAALHDLGVDMAGVQVMPGTSAKLCIRQFEDGNRAFSAELGVAATVELGSFPASYLQASHIHLGTAPPDQQLTWLRFLRDQGCTAQISADMFEHYVTHYPGASRKVCEGVDLIFMNEAEYDGLYGNGRPDLPKSPLILKRGSAGASIVTDGLPRDVDEYARMANVVDPTGGGEILAGVFLALCAIGESKMDALRYAVQAAAACVEDFGVNGQGLMMELKEIHNRLATPQV
ncbi:MAG TPA: carbohydrate kinase family protein [Streptosporangiaceae bacterium]|jgi:sugar/nucleoside kinase (ribokinase family)